VLSLPVEQMEILSGALCISLSDTEMGGQPLGQIYEKKNNAMRERENRR